MGAWAVARDIRKELHINMVAIRRGKSFRIDKIISHATTLLDSVPPCAKIASAVGEGNHAQKLRGRANVLWRVNLSKNRTQQMVDRLRELQASSPDIEASAIVSVDGLSIASALPQGVEEDRVSAMSAAMLSLGERIATELGRGSLEQVYIKGEKGYVVLMSVGQEAVLTALAREQAKLGLIFLDMRRATQDLVKLI